MKVWSCGLWLIILLAFTTVVYGAANSDSGYITGDHVYFRAQPDFYSYVISELNHGLPVTILEQAGRWCKVQLPDGQVGWVHQQYIGANKSTPPTPKPTNSNNEILSYAKSFLGVKYVYGGDTPRGFDCSGFTMYVYAKFKISLPHEADLQSEKGLEVPAMEDLKPGDLVFFTTENADYINHVGIYLGDNQFIHASSGYGAVRISPIDNGYYYDCYIGGRRVLNQSDGDFEDEPDELDE